MNLHLAEIARTVALGGHAVLLMDQAGWHVTAALIIPANITIIPLPAKCPELNPPSRACKHAPPGNGRKHLAVHAG